MADEQPEDAVPEDAVPEDEVPDEPGTRLHDFEVSGPVELDLSIGSGQVEVRLTDSPGVHVELRHDPDHTSSLAQGVSALANWLGGALGQDQSAIITPAAALHRTRVELTGKRLVVHTPNSLPLRTVPIAVTITAPAGSQITVRTMSAQVHVTGKAGRVDVATGSGETSIDEASGVLTVRTGGGPIRVGTAEAGLRARSGGGSIEVSALHGNSTIATGSGTVWLGEVAADVIVRTGSGSLTVTDAVSGQVELITGYGDVRVGVRPGTLAQVDLSSSSGRATSELDVSDTPPDDREPALRLRARTGSGTAVLTRSASPGG